MKFNMISIDGIDKSGKGLVFKYLQHLGNHKHVLLDRGPLSNYMFSKMFDRKFEYDIASFSNVLIVFLDVDYSDWRIRCKIADEPSISFDTHCEFYNDAICRFRDNGCTVLRYNTTQMTPYNIALDVISFFERNSDERQERHN